MPDKKEVITGLECCSKGADREPTWNNLTACNCGKCPYNKPGIACTRALSYDALSLLKAQEPRVLQFGELLGYEGAIWPELTFGDGRRAVMPPCMSEGYVMSDDTTGLRSTSSILWMDIKEYGKTWRCWTSRPTDEQ